jgi:hypothetical protein
VKFLCYYQEWIIPGWLQVLYWCSVLKDVIFQKEGIILLLFMFCASMTGTVWNFVFIKFVGGTHIESSASQSSRTTAALTPVGSRAT